MHELDPASQAELDEIGDAALSEVVARIQADPSGNREPQHRYTRRFKDPRRYVKVGKGERVWELYTNHYRALFISVEMDDRRGIFFLPIKKKRFWRIGECPWH